MIQSFFSLSVWSLNLLEVWVGQNVKLSLTHTVHNEEVTLAMWGVPPPGEVCGMETLSPPRILGVTSAFFSWPPALDFSGGSALELSASTAAGLYWLKFLHSFHLYQSQLADSSVPTDFFLALSPVNILKLQQSFFVVVGWVGFQLMQQCCHFFSWKQTTWLCAKHNSYMSQFVSWTYLLNTEGIQSKHGHRWHGVMCCLSSSANLTNCSSNLNPTRLTAQLKPRQSKYMFYLLCYKPELSPSFRNLTCYSHFCLRCSEF